MRRVPQRHSTVRVTGVDGTTYQGDGESLALAMRDLGRKHRAGRPAAERDGRGDGGEAAAAAAAAGATRWRVTPAGAAYLEGLRDGRDGATQGAGR